MKVKRSFLGLVVVLLVACSSETYEVTSEKPSTLKYTKVFEGQSVFYDKIPADAVVDPNSETMVLSLIDEAEKGFVVAVKEWTIPVYYSTDSTVRSDVIMTKNWAPKNVLKNVPIPDYAEPDPEGDGPMVVIDEQDGCIYDFWQIRNVNGQWKASWGNALPLNSNGIFEKGFSARGSGFELLQGMIWPQELEAGKIEHALAFSYDHTKAGGPVLPATESDGTSNDDWAIPEGALVQLNPAIDLSTYGLDENEMIIAKALQEYGMYCVDDGGGITLYAVNPNSVSTNPYEKIWGDRTYFDLSKLPVEQFRILKLPEQYYIEPEIVANSCAEYE